MVYIEEFDKVLNDTLKVKLKSETELKMQQRYGKDQPNNTFHFWEIQISFHSIPGSTNCPWTSYAALIVASITS